MNNTDTSRRGAVTSGGIGLGRVPNHLPLSSLLGGIVSWHASGYVKKLTHHKDGTRLTAREKLILFVLADSHNEDRGNCAWIGIEKAARDSLTSRSRFIELLGRLEAKGTISVQRRQGQSNLYFFPDLPVRESDPPTPRPVRKSDPTRPIATGPHPSDSCRTQAFNEPLGTDIQPLGERPHINLVLQAIEESKRTGESADTILKQLKRITQ